MMRRVDLLLLPLVLVLAAGCSHEGLDRRFQAEKARYWAERSALRYSLEADPRVRLRYYRTGMSYLRVADRADTTGLGVSIDPQVRHDLIELRGWGLVRAGDAFLRAAHFELADKELALAQREGFPHTRAQAALLRAEAERSRERWPEAFQRYREFHAILRADPPAGGLDEGVLNTPILFVTDLRAAGLDSLVEEARTEGHAFYDWVQENWKGQACAERAAFLDHRLDLAAADWEAALRSLDAYLRRDLRESDRLNADFDRAEILSQGLGRLAQADSLYLRVQSQADDPALQGLAALRRCEIAVLEGRVEDAEAGLRAVQKDFADQDEIVAAALFRRAELQEEAGDWAEAQKLYRRVVLRYPDSTLGIEAPLRLIALHRRRGDERSVHGALVRAEEQYQRLVAGHSSDSPVAVQARRNLIDCFLQQDKIQEALYELEQLYHVLGSSLEGGEALLEAARIAHERLHDPRLARRYLVWVEREMPANRVGERAREMLRELEPSKGKGS